MNKEEICDKVFTLKVEIGMQKLDLFMAKNELNGVNFKEGDEPLSDERSVSLKIQIDSINQKIVEMEKECKILFDKYFQIEE